MGGGSSSHGGQRGDEAEARGVVKSRPGTAYCWAPQKEVFVAEFTIPAQKTGTENQGFMEPREILPCRGGRKGRSGREKNAEHGAARSRTEQYAAVRNNSTERHEDARRRSSME